MPKMSWLYSTICSFFFKTPKVEPIEPQNEERLRKKFGLVTYKADPLFRLIKEDLEKYPNERLIWISDTETRRLSPFSYGWFPVIDMRLTREGCFEWLGYDHRYTFSNKETYRLTEDFVEFLTKHYV
jgi:hypothetical protein